MNVFKDVLMDVRSDTYGQIINPDTKEDFSKLPQENRPIELKDLFGVDLTDYEIVPFISYDDWLNNNDLVDLLRQEEMQNMRWMRMIEKFVEKAKFNEEGQVSPLMFVLPCESGYGFVNDVYIHDQSDPESRQIDINSIMNVLFLGGRPLFYKSWYDILINEIE